MDGLLGDVIFFAVSGFCLYNIKDGFIQWYKKRIKRIYPTVWIITIIYIIVGFYTFEDMNIFQYMIYPTYYHFIASIILLYILYYIIIKNKKFLSNLKNVILCVGIIQLIIYIFLYDKSYYHIDVVREPMIRFLFFEAMLIGAYFRQNKEKYIDKSKSSNWIITGCLLCLYFGSKLIFTKIKFLSYFQICNQYILIATLFFTLKSFAGIDNKLEKIPKRIKKIISFISDITLEIYLVQYVIIPRLANIIFPLNWLIITTSIIICAFILHKVSGLCVKIMDKLGLIIKGRSN